MKVFNIILSIILVISGVCMIITKNYDYIFYYMVLLGTLILITGIHEIRRKENEFDAYLSIIGFCVLFIYYLWVFGIN